MTDEIKVDAPATPEATPTDAPTVEVPKADAPAA